MQKSSEYSIKFICKTFKVSRSRYYEWLKGNESKRQKENRALSVEIKAIYNETHQTYGAIRIHKELTEKGKLCGKNRVARLMKIENIQSIHKTKFRACTTNSKHNLTVADNVINQDFTATAPNQKWGADITYIKTGEGFLYLAIILDFFSRKIVGWAASDNINADLCCSALKMALIRRRPPKELIHHSDRGVQYASSDYRQILIKNKFSQSMSRKGNCYDNAMVESFMHTLKVERVNRRVYFNNLSAQIDVADYIENFYNSKRRHSSIDYLSPVNYEAKLKKVA
jgi:transposase InsO family protein